MEHFNLWATYPLEPDEVARHVAPHVQDREWIVFENPPALMSVPSVCCVYAVCATPWLPAQMWHVHILARRAR